MSDDPHDDPAYCQFVHEMAKICRCESLDVRPCEGVLAGGVCDRMDWTKIDDEDFDL